MDRTAEAYPNLNKLPMGIRVLLGGDEEDEAQDTANRLGSSASFTLVVALIAIGGGGEELAVFIPFLGSLAMPELVVALVTLVLLVPVWCRVSQRIASIKRIQGWIARYQGYSYRLSLLASACSSLLIPAYWMCLRNQSLHIRSGRPKEEPTLLPRAHARPSRRWTVEGNRDRLERWDS